MNPENRSNCVEGCGNQSQCEGQGGRNRKKRSFRKGATLPANSYSHKDIVRAEAQGKSRVRMHRVVDSVTGPSGHWL